MSLLSNEAVIRNLQALGLAHPTTGRLLAGALIDPTTVVGASVQSTDNLLNSVSLDDEMLAPENRGLLIAAWGALAANGNTKDVKLKIGSTAILTLTDSTANAKDFFFFAIVIRTGVDTQIGSGLLFVDGAEVAASSINFTATEDANVAKTISTTGDNNSAAASAATGKGLVVLPFGG